jgi:hypothetical protein
LNTNFFYLKWTGELRRVHVKWKAGTPKIPGATFIFESCNMNAAALARAIKSILPDGRVTQKTCVQDEVTFPSFLFNLLCLLSL